MTDSQMTDWSTMPSYAPRRNERYVLPRSSEEGLSRHRLNVSMRPSRRACARRSAFVAIAALVPLSVAVGARVGKIANPKDKAKDAQVHLREVTVADTAEPLLSQLPPRRISSGECSHTPRLKTRPPTTETKDTIPKAEKISIKSGHGEALNTKIANP